MYAEGEFLFCGCLRIERSEAERELTEIKGFLTLIQTAFRFDLIQSGCHFIDDVRMYRITVMSGENAADIETFQFPDGFGKLYRIGGRIKSINLSVINQITGKQISSLRFIKHAVSGRMSRCMNDLKIPVSCADCFSSCICEGRSAPKNIPSCRIKIIRKDCRLFNQIIQYCRAGNRELFTDPGNFCFMHTELFKASVGSDMVPMNMRCQYCYRTVIQLFDNRTDIPDSGPGVNQKSSVRTAQQPAVCLFTMPVFADAVCIRINLLCFKPFVHRNRISENDQSL